MTVDSIAEAILQLSVLDVAELNKKLEEKVGPLPSMSAPSAAPAAAATSDTQPEAAAKSEFSVNLIDFGSQKVGVIRAIKKIVNLSLGDAKAAVESTANGPYEVKAGVSKEDADTIKKELEEAGASVEIK